MSLLTLIIQKSVESVALRFLLLLASCTKTCFKITQWIFHLFSLQSMKFFKNLSSISKIKTVNFIH